MNDVSGRMATRSSGARNAGGATNFGSSDFAALGRELAEKGVKHCLAAYVDLHGIPKAKGVPISHFARMMRGSELFTGAALDGLGQGPSDDELAIHPDAAAIAVLPWRREVAWVPGGLHFHDEPWPMCSRNVLRVNSAKPRSKSRARSGSDRT